jgi:hypothetical protein
VADCFQTASPVIIVGRFQAIGTAQVG